MEGPELLRHHMEDKYTKRYQTQAVFGMSKKYVPVE